MTREARHHHQPKIFCGHDQPLTTLVALGDSLTAGYGLPAEEGFVPQLQAWLRAQGADVRGAVLVSLPPGGIALD